MEQIDFSNPWLWIGVALYLLPVFLGVFRRHYRLGHICILGFLFGWTGIGWLIALVLSCSNSRNHIDSFDESMLG